MQDARALVAMHRLDLNRTTAVPRPQNEGPSAALAASHPGVRNGYATVRRDAQGGISNNEAACAHDASAPSSTERARHRSTAS